MALPPPSSSLAEEKASTAAVILSRGLPDPDEAQLAPLPRLAQGRAVIASSNPLARLLNAFLVAAKQLLSSPLPLALACAKAARVLVQAAPLNSRLFSYLL